MERFWVVSHDRGSFFDNVATSVLAIDSNGMVEEFVGGWSDWKRQQEAFIGRSRLRSTTGTQGLKRRL